MRRAAAVWLILIVLSISTAQSAAHAQGSPVPIEMHRQGDVLVIVVVPAQPISLGGLRFQISRDNVPQTPIFLREYPAFQGVDFYNFTEPACFALRPGDVDVPLPLICQRLDPNRVYVQTLFASDVFWNDRVLQQPRTITVLNDAGTRVSDCPASSFLCEIAFTFAPPTDPPQSAPALAGDPADVDSREVLVLISEFEVFSEAAGERVNPQLSWQRQFQEAIDTVDDIQNARVLSIPRVIRSHDEAREVSEQYQATMVVWGYVDAAAVASNYTITPRWSTIEFMTAETGTEVFTSTLDEMALYVSRESDVDFMLNFLIGQLLYFEDNFADAYEFFQAAMGQIPSTRSEELNATALFYYSGYIAAVWEENYQQAIEYFDLALDTSPYNAAIYFNRGRAYHGLGDFEHALADYNLAILLDPAIVGAYSNRARIYLESGDDARALADYNRLIEMDPTNPEFIWARGYLYHYIGEYSDALVDYDRALEFNPELLPVYVNRALVYTHLGEYERALADYDRALSLDPDFLPVFINRGNAYYALGEYARAISDYDRAIELDPTNVDTYWNRGNAYILLENYELAISDFDQAIKLDQSAFNAFASRGLAYENIGDLERAIADYRTYVELTGQEAVAYFVERIAELEAQLRD